MDSDYKDSTEASKHEFIYGMDAGLVVAKPLLLWIIAAANSATYEENIPCGTRSIVARLPVRNALSYIERAASDRLAPGEPMRLFIALNEVNTLLELLKTDPACLFPDALRRLQRMLLNPFAAMINRHGSAWPHLQ